ncbi:MAG: Rid family hydrolase [SAR324 cluster bacterium]|nr:Rid family hydrolase [SAR324 cluster bacterium]
MKKKTGRSAFVAFRRWETPAIGDGQLLGISLRLFEGGEKRRKILVSGTTAIHGEDRVICRDDPRGQAVYILDKILSAVSALGGQRSDIIRTRVYLTNQDHCESVSRVHGRYFEGLNPANTTIEVSNLIGDHLVEIEAEAIVDEE